jgi:hypothetical protein
MSTLEILAYDHILWRNQTPQQVRDKLYPTVHLSQIGYPHRSLDPQAVFCQGWSVDGKGVTLVEITP